jgi:fatty-acyl-CoA synthase
MEVVAQRVEGVRLGGVAAFSVSGFGDEELAILVVESRERDLDQRDKLTHEITRLMHEHFGINIIIDLVKPGTLPRTSSGKLSRYQSREAFLGRQNIPAYNLPGTVETKRKIA